MTGARTRASMAEQAQALQRLLVRLPNTHDAAWEAETLAHELLQGNDSEAARRAAQLVKELGRRAPRHVYAAEMLQEGIEGLRRVEPDGPHGATHDHMWSTDDEGLLSCDLCGTDLP